MLGSQRGRVARWIARYLPLEVLGTVAAVAGAAAGYEASGSLVTAAVVGTVAEGVGYYALVVVRGIRSHLASKRVRRHAGRPRRAFVAVVLTLRGLVAEFGPAEALDTFLVRPALLVAATAALGPNPTGWLVGKLAADAVFYAVAIVSFETGRRLILPDGGADAARRPATARPGATEAAPDPVAPAPSPPRLEGALR
ncbi:hypothetical protein GCM10017608_12410 [Agromyces luteolus]|uniref:Uncharacterized protein n=1 Tax=Agromyces luteolus TaxID=88373 RepID=A0A7C9HQR9_9MICO|nr:hypothetical protein [Agromyces luteolus]MUN07109.1 hypothetical protein [Agromyces luteolus]GLK27307.1 hypothetical protein GCM10017608_12410 [Agromyces luteolus]